MAILSFFLGRKIDSLEKEVNRLFDTLKRLVELL